MSPDSFSEYDDAVLQVVTGEEGLHDTPIVTQMDFGHTDPMCVLPYGIKAEIDPVGKRVSLLENAVA